METDILALSYIAEFFLESEVFQTKIVEKMKTNFIYNNDFSKIVLIMI
jgi:hypothetical protein